MKNIVVLTQKLEKKGTTDFAAFFEHEGMFARLDWELANDAGVDPEFVAELMLDQIANDLADEETVAKIRAQNKANPRPIEDTINKWKENGWQEWEVIGLTAKAVDRFGDK